MEKKLVLLAGGFIIFIIIIMLSFSTTTTMTIRQTTFAQTNNNNNNNSATYENPTYRIKIQYPSDWKTEEGTAPHFSVSFIAPSTRSNSDTTTTPPALIRFGVDNLPSGDFSLEDFTNIQITGARQTYPSFTLYQLNSTTLAGNPAQQLVFSTIDDKQHEAKSMQVFMIKDNKSYHITYIAKPESYSEFLPIAQKMIDSFEFI
jgi:serine/threonine-protein kinase